MGRPCGFDAGEGFEIMRPIGAKSLLDRYRIYEGQILQDFAAKSQVDLLPERKAQEAQWQPRDPFVELL